MSHLCLTAYFFQSIAAGLCSTKVTKSYGSGFGYFLGRPAARVLASRVASWSFAPRRNHAAAAACSAPILLASVGFCRAGAVVSCAASPRRRHKNIAGCRARIPLRPLARGISNFLLFLGREMEKVMIHSQFRGLK